jgi:predicted regulator of Ras-like GTPase activity (Roadblock/LC7/MglB family)
MSRAEQLSAALDELLEVSVGIEAAAVVSADGLPLASALPPDIQEDGLAAMSAALLSLGERAATSLGKGELAQVLVKGERGHLMLMAAGVDHVLVAVTRRNAKLGLVLFEMGGAAARIVQALETAQPLSEPVSDNVFSTAVGDPGPPGWQ